MYLYNQIIYTYIQLKNEKDLSVKFLHLPIDPCYIYFT